MDVIKKIKEQHPDILLLFVCKFGSHLYGTDTPESDTDYKGIFMPTSEMVCLNKIPKSLRLDSNNTNEKNSKDDVDLELYSLHYFIELALKGETAALDMLHAPSHPECVVLSTPIFESLHKERARFYTNNLKAFVGYARGQAAKYGIKGSRLAVARDVVRILDEGLDTHCLDARMEAIWDQLPDAEHCHHIDKDTDPKQYQVCGKVLQSTQRIRYARDILQGFIDKFGHRAELAARNEGIDWKAISHAMRAAYQVAYIFWHGDIKFPLKDAPYLKEIKEGKLNYLHEVAPILEGLMSHLEVLAENTSLPAKPDRKWVENFLYVQTKMHIRYGG